jgi:uncharacterized protein YndB with AHSA1/START domain
MSRPEFIYTTYIETSADKLWQALTDGDFTERYWFGHRVVGLEGGIRLQLRQGRCALDRRQGPHLRPDQTACLLMGLLFT